jgi:hypothetical protein
VADDPNVAFLMLESALSKISGPVFIDASDQHEGLTMRLENYGFTKQRPFLRMAKGRNMAFGSPKNLFAMAGPELG